MVGDGLVEVHGHLQEEVPDAQVTAEQARRLEPGKGIKPILCLSDIQQI